MNLRAGSICVCFQLLVMAASAAGIGEPNLDEVSHRAAGAIQPAVSPDGRTVAVSFQGAIATLPIDGGTLKRLTLEAGWDIEPAWSPDGRRLAYWNSSRMTAGTLRLIDAETGAPVELPRTMTGRGRIQFHPDGRRLLGMFSPGGFPDRLQWYDLETGEATPVGINALEPLHLGRMRWALSPDGGTLVFTKNLDLPGEQEGNNGPGTELWRVRSTGGEPGLIARWPARVFGLCFEPEGSAVLLVTDRGGAHYDLWRLPLAGAAVARPVSEGRFDEDGASVSGDGRWLVYTDNAERATALTRVDRLTGDRSILRVERVAFPVTTGRLQLELRDGLTGAPLTARVSVSAQDGKYYHPQGALYRLYQGHGMFYARDQAEMEVPAGTVTIRVWKGPEYLVTERTVDVAPGASERLRLELVRWINMPERGWYSGENHIHANYGYGAWHNDPSTVRDQCEGEDLHVANVMVANSDGDGVFDRPYFLGAPDPLSSDRTILYWNEEFRSTIWGHLTLGNLSRLVEPIFTGFADTTNPWDVPTNADIAVRTRAQGGAVSYTHPASNAADAYDSAYSAKGLPVDAALGRVDTLDVMGWGYRESLPLWYSLLNCGFRIPAAAGTDVFLNRIVSAPPGWGRAYVRLTNGLNYSAWIEGQRAGRSFVTSGPMLDLTVNGHAPGETLQLDRPGSVTLEAVAWYPGALDSLEVVVNGQVYAVKDAGTDRDEIRFSKEVQVERSGWVAVRCSAGNGRLFAHMNPVYLEVGDQPTAAAEDAAQLLRWIDRLEADLRRRDRIPRTELESVRSQIESARAVYRARSVTPLR